MNHLLLMIILAGLVTPIIANAAPGLPKWELGFGPAMISYPDYPGSKEQNTLLLPIPYFVYRGKGFSIDNKELNKPFFNKNNIELDLSASGNIPVSSKDNVKRLGMDNLDGSIGLGPVLKHTLYKNTTGEVKFELSLQAIIASDFTTVHSEGWLTRPGFFYYYQPTPSNHNRLEITTGISAQFASSDYHNYLYSVPTEFANSGRPAYKSDGGFSGINYSLGLSYHFEDFWLGAFWRGFDLSQAAYKDSPLVDSQFSQTFGLSLTWNFLKSKGVVYGYE